MREWFERVDHHPLTIGHFYHEIARAIIALGPDIFVKDTGRQLTPKNWGGAPGKLYSVHDQHTALLAIHEIIVQGEGTSVSDPGDSPYTEGGQGLGHYFRFKEIVEGRRMIKTADGSWRFAGAHIPFDPRGVVPMVDDPEPFSLPRPSRVATASDLFNDAYRGLLRGLHETFNGNPAALDQAAALMYSVEVLGRKLVAMPIDPASPQTAGPSFQAL